MCTICGQFNLTAKPTAEILNMLRMMEHRGPDTHGLYQDGRVDYASDINDLERVSGEARIVLGHSRLRIVGEDHPQPYLSYDGALCLIHNGELYNYPELELMLPPGITVESQTDSEVLVHLLREYYQGELLTAVQEVMPLLDGMYAFAVTDGKALVLARDPVGKKPIYYKTDGTSFQFASEQKALWDGESLLQRLLPGYVLQVSEDGIQEIKVMELPIPQIDIHYDEEIDLLYYDAIQRSVEKRLTGVRSERVGIIFSGGVDSVLIAKLIHDRGKDVRCYCVGTPDSPDLKAARQASDLMGLQLRTHELSYDEVEKLIPEIIARVEESGLLQVEVAIPMYIAAKMAHEDDIRVMYTGQAADELFAGYDWYRKVVKEEGYAILHRHLWDDLRCLYQDTLEREDRMTMAHSIELRAPYLDREVIRIAMRTIPSLKLLGPDDFLRKHPHRRVAQECGVAEEIAQRTKDPAQSGSGIHMLIEEIASQSGIEPDVMLVEKNLERDSGSLYRYKLGRYGSARARSYLQVIEEDMYTQKAIR
jgi:asparagine synthase (glutamine-hydrolysing)